MRSRLPTGGHMNRDKALAFQSPLTSRINLSSLFLNTFTSLDTTTSSGRKFHGSTTRDVKLFLHTSRQFLFLYNLLLFFLTGLLSHLILSYLILSHLISSYLISANARKSYEN